MSILFPVQIAAEFKIVLPNEDESHERSLQTDILMGLLKGLLGRRNNSSKAQCTRLKLVIMSATLGTISISLVFVISLYILLPCLESHITSTFLFCCCCSISCCRFSCCCCCCCCCCWWWWWWWCCCFSI